MESLQAPRAISSTARRHGISRSLLMTWGARFARNQPALKRNKRKRYERPTEPRTWCGRPTHRA
ncbi:hypothetical protein [Bradyrhizobium liaoningense]|uniref:hypothetical protein n=1 Tax=Bradyrhizobium liaoningense TaxID=43992 RepID=UPI0024E06FF5|nr:hypothetical protein [Bradyrhizobium liaoningense]WLB92736.1 hypothetical protein QIH91_14155 [Bradyrhizobium japonicum USDA 135]